MHGKSRTRELIREALRLAEFGSLLEEGQNLVFSWECSAHLQQER